MKNEECNFIVNTLKIFHCVLFARLVLVSIFQKKYLSGKERKRHFVRKEKQTESVFGNTQNKDSENRDSFFYLLYFRKISE